MSQDKEVIEKIILNKSKQEYNQIPIPRDLNRIVNDVFHDYESKEKKRGINDMNDRENLYNNKTNNKANNKTNNKTMRILKRTGIGIAACFGVFVIGLNTSEAFAKGVDNIPYIGTVARVLTVRTYEDINEDRTIKAVIPQIDVEGGNEEVKSAIIDINKEIQELVDEHIKEAESHITEYKEAFLETGGTEEEFTAKNIHANVEYEVKAQSEEMISIVITSYEDWANAYTEQFFYTLDLINGNVLTLKDILGDDYINKANETIRNEMEQRVKVDEDMSYFTEAEGGFISVDENTHFYVNKSGNPVVVFAKYEVAPGFMGIQEFEIKTK